MIDALLKGVTAMTLLHRFQLHNLIPGIQHIEVRPGHIVEDGLRCLYKGNFNVSKEVEVDIAGSLTTEANASEAQLGGRE